MFQLAPEGRQRIGQNDVVRQAAAALAENSLLMTLPESWGK